jgi:H+/Cl- antiporter ClcA
VLLRQDESQAWINGTGVIGVIILLATIIMLLIIAVNQVIIWIDLIRSSSMTDSTKQERTQGLQDFEDTIKDVKG